MHWPGEVTLLSVKVWRGIYWVGFQIRSTCLREAASAKAGEIRNSKHAQMFQILISQTKFENLNFEIVSDWSETDASPDIRISKFSDGF